MTCTNGILGPCGRYDCPDCNPEASTRAMDLVVIEEMERTGGGFVRALAVAASKADPENLRRIKAAWPEYWNEYREHARLRQLRSQESAP
jgi:hypothetical protein